MMEIGKWLREKTGMQTPSEKEAAEKDARSKRQIQIDTAIDQATGERPKSGVDAGEAGKKWKDTFK